MNLSKSITAFDKLNPRSQAVAVERVEELTENPKYTEKTDKKPPSHNSRGGNGIR